MIDLVNANQTGCQLEHIVPQGNDDKLRILGSLFDITSNNRHL